MAQSKTTGGEGIVYLTRRAYESGEIRLLLRTDAVCAERDTGWQLLQGSETGLELSNPENGLLVSVARALELEPKRIKHAFIIDKMTVTESLFHFPCT